MFVEDNYNTSCQYPNTSIPIDSLVITNSYFFDGLGISFYSSVSNNQMISINSCSVYNGLFIDKLLLPNTDNGINTYSEHTIVIWRKLSLTKLIISSFLMFLSVTV